MTAPHRRHDMSYRVWELLEPHLSGRSGKKGRPAKDNRLFLNAVFWNLRTGAPPYQVRGRLWRDRGVCKDLLDTVIDEPDFEWLLMIDSSHIEPQPDGTGARGGNQAIARTKGAELQTGPGLGFPWDAGTYDPDRGNHRRLQSGRGPDCRRASPVPVGGQGL